MEIKLIIFKQFNSIITQMKTKLLRKIRRLGANQVTIYSITSSDGLNTGMSYGYNDDIFSGLFRLGDTEQDVINKAIRIYYDINIDTIRNKYKKYSVKSK